MPPIALPHPSSALHLYRHLLREATYLPPLCRPWATDRIKERFSRSRQERNPTSHIKEAHRELRFLRAANAGDKRRLVRLHHMAMGRLGRRRRQLASVYLVKPPPEDSAALEAGAQIKQHAYLSKDDKSRILGPTWLDNWDLDKVLALAKSQWEHQKKDAPKEMRRIISPSKLFVMKNCWDQPLRSRVLTGKLKRHWAAVLSLLMPPLPRGEWDILSSLVRRETAWAPLPRRPIAQPLAQETDGATQPDWEMYATKPVRMIERKHARSVQPLSGCGEPSQLSPGPGRYSPLGVSRITPRFMRRNIYRPAWEASPLVEEEVTQGGGKKWKVKWGGIDTKLSSPTTSNLPLFQGVNEKGSRTISTRRHHNEGS
ncbi:hypothetical protein BX600DRAFT_516676 [Xylariales sp. PMI_506]|nr:hypothetical protein BX600DRAFT_516676 [Xylariales sp. PMI_506]